MYSLYQVKQEGLWLSLKMQKKGWELGDFGSPGWKHVKSLISSWPHKVVIGSRLHRECLICWQRQQRGVPGDGSENTALFGSTNLQHLEWGQKQKVTLSSKQVCTFLESNTCSILRKLHFIRHKHGLCAFPSLQSIERSFKMKDATEIPTCHIFIILAMSISEAWKLHFFVAFVTVLSQVILGKPSHARIVYMRLGACKLSVQLSTGRTWMFCDLLQQMSLSLWRFSISGFLYGTSPSAHSQSPPTL